MKQLLLFTFLLISSFQFGKTLHLSNINLDKYFFQNPKEKEINDDDEIYESPKIKAEYPGGIKKLKKELEEIVYYPEEAKKRNIQGYVTVKFVVEKDGSLSNLKVYRDIGRGCGAEAIKALEAIETKWIPAYDGSGNPVRSSNTLKVLFKK